MANPWLVIAAVIGIAALYVLLPHVRHTFVRFRAGRTVRCPEAGTEARIGVNAARAAVTSAFGSPSVRVEGCSLWPDRRGCAQACLDAPEMR
jgi:hypothetical protein